MEKFNSVKRKVYFKICKRRENKNITKIIKNSMYVKQNINNESVIGYIKFIKDIDVPSRTLCKNIIIETYKAIKNSIDVEDSIKSDLRILLECKGISFVY
ncbi:hypothetical protein [Clostridium massiliodielmoense]|uniref:hypothetical protein n=1 Tax=Clostridium massiliodielmoense TaxID=1776385 RepID=UPI00016677CF|nr:hypothetical protein [Clostridium massiliodielmoense]EDS77730.1 early transcription factor 70 kDa subunit [Clostridium botulinum C str. Eklund]KEH97290.1 transcription factor [Clostridium botulinum C/D str. BKT12695]NEZ49181.1 transcription factor [Clostridium botulinum]